MKSIKLKFIKENNYNMWVLWGGDIIDYFMSGDEKILKMKKEDKEYIWDNFMDLVKSNINDGYGICYYIGGRVYKFDENEIKKLKEDIFG